MKHQAAAQFSDPPRSLRQRAFDLTLIAIASILIASAGARSLTALAQAETWWLLPVGLLAGLLCADFASGAVHWFCDSFFEEDTPVLGRALIEPFRAHHSDPQGMVRHGLLELHGNSCIPVIAALSLALLLPSERSGSGALAIHVWLVFFAAASMATNQFHMWAHAPAAPRAVRWLQHRGLILSPERHARHHSGDFTRSYCITCGWMNPALDRIDFFPRAERLIRALRVGA